MKGNREKTVFLTKVSILSALAAVLQLFEISLPLIPEFYKLDFSGVVTLTGTFALGPFAGILIELMKNLLHLLLKGTTTAFVGEAANFLMGCALALPAGFVYLSHRTRKGALTGALLGTVSLITFGALMNYFVLIPAYSHFYGMDIGTIISLCSKVNPGVSDLKTLIVFAVMPFNLLKGLLSTFVTFLLYKKVSPLLHAN